MSVVPSWLRAFEIDLEHDAPFVSGRSNKIALGQLVALVSHPEVFSEAGLGHPGLIVLAAEPLEGREYILAEAARRTGRRCFLWPTDAERRPVRHLRSLAKLHASAGQPLLVGLNPGELFLEHTSEAADDAIIELLATLRGPGRIVLVAFWLRYDEAMAALTNHAVALSGPDAEEYTAIIADACAREGITFTSEPDYAALACVVADWPVGEVRIFIAAFAALVAGTAVTPEHLAAALGLDDATAHPSPIDADELWRTCLHESGHVAAFLALGGPAAMRSVWVARAPNEEGRVRGLTNGLISGERGWLADAAISAAGRAAEELFFGNVQEGAETDLANVRGGLLDEIATALDDERLEKVGLGITQADAVLPAVISSLLVAKFDQALGAARSIVVANREPIERFARILLERHELSGDALRDAFAEAGFLEIKTDEGFMEIACVMKRPIFVEPDLCAELRAEVCRYTGFTPPADAEVDSAPDAVAA